MPDDELDGETPDRTSEAPASRLADPGRTGRLASLLGFGGVRSQLVVAVLLAALGYAVSAITVRVLAHTDTQQAIIAWLMLLLTVGAGTLAWIGGWVPLARSDAWTIAGVGLAGTVGQYLITAAFLRGEASVLAPLEYTALAWGLLLDFFVWHALPDGTTWVGAAIIVASGLYLLRREPARVEAEHVEAEHP